MELKEKVCEWLRRKSDEQARGEEIESTTSRYRECAELLREAAEALGPFVTKHTPIRYVVVGDKFIRIERRTVNNSLGGGVLAPGVSIIKVETYPDCVGSNPVPCEDACVKTDEEGLMDDRRLQLMDDPGEEEHVAEEAADRGR